MYLSSKLYRNETGTGTWQLAFPVAPPSHTRLPRIDSSICSLGNGVEEELINQSNIQYQENNTLSTSLFNAIDVDGDEKAIDSEERPPLKESWLPKRYSLDCEEALFQMVNC